MSSAAAEGPAGAGALRTAVSFFTVLPVRASFDRHTAGQAMLLAPAVGAVLGLLAGGVVLAGRAVGLGQLSCAVAAVGFLAAATRGLHLDGLADLADGLGAASDRERALEVMRRGDIGAFGVVVVVITLLLQVAAVAELGAQVVAALAVAGIVGRTWVPIACRTGVPAARADGLGAVVAGSVAPAAAAAVVGTVAAVVAVVVMTTPLLAWQAAAVPAALLAAAVVHRAAVRRLGGITGDTVGACIETGTTVALVVLASGW